MTLLSMHKVFYDCFKNNKINFKNAEDWNYYIMELPDNSKNLGEFKKAAIFGLAAILPLNGECQQIITVRKMGFCCPQNLEYSIVYICNHNKDAPMVIVIADKLLVCFQRRNHVFHCYTLNMSPKCRTNLKKSVNQG